MTIKVRFFASLREQIGCSEVQIDTLLEPMTVEQIWAQVRADEPLPPHILKAVNMEYVSSGALVRDGDEVAFFPPVTGG